MRYFTGRRIGKAGPVVVGFVDDAMRRRTVAVPFGRSTDENVSELIEHVNAHAVMIPSGLDDGRGE